VVLDSNPFSIPSSLLEIDTYSAKETGTCEYLWADHSMSNQPHTLNVTIVGPSKWAKNTSAWSVELNQILYVSAMMLAGEPHSKLAENF
jgi:hypothetical protein